MHRGLALSLAFLLLGTAQALGPVATPADDAAGSVTGVFGALPAQPAPPGTEGGAPVSCSGTAPLQVDCSAAFTAVQGQPYTMTVNGGAGFTGTIVAVLADSAGHHRGLSCAFVAFLGGVTPPPDCQVVAGDELVAGPITLSAAVTAPSNVPVSLGFWEVDVR